VVAHPWTAPPELGAGVDAAVFGDPDAWREGWWRFASAVALAMGGVLLGVGGASGAVVNPAYAVAGRAAHALLPVGRTGDVAWGAAAWSTVGACAGAALAAAVAKAVWG
jgi:glycerol uptake facilitator-like aquaporin